MIFSKRNPPPGFYVYLYLRSNDSTHGKKGTPYYVGKGKGDRAWADHSIHIPTDPRNIVIYQYDISDTWAFIQERYFIRWFGRIDNGTGILRNMTDGGEGRNNSVVSSFTRQLLRDQQKEKVNDGTHHLLGGDIQRNYMNSLSDIEKTALVEHITKIATAGAALQLSEYRHPSQIKKTCDHCGVTCSANTFGKYHGDRCSHNPNNPHIHENVHLRKQVHTPDGIFSSRTSTASHYGITPQGVRARCLSTSPTWIDWHYL